MQVAALKTRLKYQSRVASVFKLKKVRQFFVVTGIRNLAQWCLRTTSAKGTVVNQSRNIFAHFSWNLLLRYKLLREGSFVSWFEVWSIFNKNRSPFQKRLFNSRHRQRNLLHEMLLRFLHFGLFMQLYWVLFLFLQNMWTASIGVFNCIRFVKRLRPRWHWGVRKLLTFF